MNFFLFRENGPEWEFISSLPDISRLDSPLAISCGNDCNIRRPEVGAHSFPFIGEEEKGAHDNAMKCAAAPSGLHESGGRVRIHP